MVKVIFLDKQDSFLSSLFVKPEDEFNKTLRRKRSVLDIALKNNIDIKYGCMGGSCSACICKVTKGEEYIDKEGLHKNVFQGLKEGEFLSCISTFKDDVPDDVEIEIKKLV